MREHQSEFDALGTRLAAIGLGDANYARMFRESSGISFPLLIDEERAAYRAIGLRSGNLLHLFKKENAAARARAREAGFKQERMGRHPFQLGGSLVFASGGKELFLHRSHSFGDNASIAELLGALSKAK